MMLVKSSTIMHPLSKNKIYRFKCVTFAYRQLSPWKTYYDVRNKIFISKKYFGRQLWTITIPGIILRAFMSLFTEKKRLQVLHMYTKGIIDGLYNRKGKRVLPYDKSINSI